MAPPSPPPSASREHGGAGALHWRDATYAEIAALDARRLVAILPVGAVEAHGPHLPLSTDPIIAVAMAESAAVHLQRHDLLGVLLPPLEYSPAPFAAAFPGTLSLRPETLVTVIEDIAAALAEHEVRSLAIANAHLDPAHLAALHESVRRIEQRGEIVVAFPDICRKPWALRLGDEFRSGACHAGRYETSIVQAARPDLVRDAKRRALPANPSSLSDAIRSHKTTFEEAGGPQAYFGAPADATPEEGRLRIEELGQILTEAVLERLRHEAS